MIPIYIDYSRIGPFNLKVTLKIEGGFMMKTDWYMVFLYFVMMLIIGFFVFNNSVSTLIFGISGATIGWILHTNKTQEECRKSN